MSFEARDIYVKVKEADATPYIQEHRVWDAALFLDSLQAEHKKAGKGTTVELSSKDEYLKARAQ